MYLIINNYVIIIISYCYFFYNKNACLEIKQKQNSLIKSFWSRFNLKIFII